MAMAKKTPAPKKPAPNNSVRTKNTYIKLPATPVAKPTMRSNAKDIVNKASAKAKSNALKAANAPAKPTVSKAAAIQAAAKRALLVPPAQRTEAQKRAIANARTGGLKPVPNRGGIFGGRRPRGGGSAGGLGINDMNR